MYLYSFNIYYYFCYCCCYYYISVWRWYFLHKCKFNSENKKQETKSYFWLPSQSSRTPPTQKTPPSTCPTGAKGGGERHTDMVHVCLLRVVISLLFILIIGGVWVAPFLHSILHQIHIPYEIYSFFRIGDVLLFPHFIKEKYFLKQNT